MEAPLPASPDLSRGGYLIGLRSHFMPPADDSLRSTFPIPDKKIRARKWKLALGSPVTWAPYLPVVGAFAFLDIGAGWFAALAAAVTAGIGWYWKNHNAKLEGKLLEELISESNQQQDLHLFEVARNLSESGHSRYASTMASFVEKKQQIERAIHGDGDGLTAPKKEVETLTDAVAFGVADQLERLGQLDDRLNKSPVPLTDEQRRKIEEARQAVSDQVHSAWNTLEDTWQNLGRLLNPAGGIVDEDATHLELDKAIERLRHEQDIARKVNDRMSQEWSQTFGDYESDLTMPVEEPETLNDSANS